MTDEKKETRDLGPLGFAGVAIVGRTEDIDAFLATVTSIPDDDECDPVNGQLVAARMASPMPGTARLSNWTCSTCNAYVGAGHQHTCPVPCPGCGVRDCNGAPRFEGLSLDERIALRAKEEAARGPGAAPPMSRLDIIEAHLRSALEEVEEAKSEHNRPCAPCALDSQR